MGGRPAEPGVRAERKGGLVIAAMAVGAVVVFIVALVWIEAALDRRRRHRELRAYNEWMERAFSEEAHQ